MDDPYYKMSPDLIDKVCKTLNVPGQVKNITRCAGELNQLPDTEYERRGELWLRMIREPEDNDKSKGKTKGKSRGKGRGKGRKQGANSQ